jgi:hypothetical protein
MKFIDFKKGDLIIFEGSICTEILEYNDRYSTYFELLENNE